MPECLPNESAQPLRSTRVVASLTLEPDARLVLLELHPTRVVPGNRRAVTPFA